MRTLIVLILLAAGLAGIGFYMGWFQLGTDNTADTSNVTLSVDKDKMKEDKDKAVEKVRDLGHQAADKVDSKIDKNTPPSSQPLEIR